MVLNGWYVCPTCGNRLHKIPADSIMYNTPIWCRHCKVEWYPAIYEGVELDADEPFPLTK